MGRSGKKRRRVEDSRRSLPTSRNATQKKTRSTLSVSQLQALRAYVDMMSTPTRPRAARHMVPTRLVVGPVAKAVANPSGVFKRHLANLKKIAGPIVPNRPEKTVCEARRERREVIFAKGQGGRSGQKSPVWTRKSKIKC